VHTSICVCPNGWQPVKLLAADAELSCFEKLKILLKCCCARHSLQVGTYSIAVATPTTLPGIVVLGNPLVVSVRPGIPNASNSNVNITGPSRPVVGSIMTASIWLRDTYNNPITKPAQGEYTHSYVNIVTGTTKPCWAETVLCSATKSSKDMFCYIVAQGIEQAIMLDDLHPFHNKNLTP
jgi:hypothetical protein